MKPMGYLIFSAHVFAIQAALARKNSIGAKAEQKKAGESSPGFSHRPASDEGQLPCALNL